VIHSIGDRSATGQLHGVRAENLEAILDGIDKREASYGTPLYSYEAYVATNEWK
jgi:hypothetical protein